MADHQHIDRRLAERLYRLVLTNSLYFFLGTCALLADGSLADDKADVEQHLKLGRQFLSQGKIGDALTQFHSAIHLDPDNYLAYFQRATVYQVHGRPLQAVNDYSRALELRPNFHMARMKRGEVYQRQGDFDGALHEFEYLLTVKFDSQEEVKQHLQELDDLQAQTDEANQLLSQHDLAPAIAIFSDLIKSCPWDVYLRLKRADAYQAFGDLPLAISDVRYAAGLKLDASDLHLRLSMMLYHNGALDESLKAIRECLKLDADNAECQQHYRIVKKQAKLYVGAEDAYERQQYDECAESLERLLSDKKAELPPRARHHALVKRCDCLSRSDKGDGKETIDVCSKVLEAEEKNVEALIGRAEGRILQEDFDGAVEDLKLASEADPHNQRVQEKLQRAENLKKQASKRDYYKILGVKRNAKKREIIKAYRRLAQEWHPDLFPDPEERKHAEKRFIDIAAAKEVLTDPEKREQFDQGQDPLDAEQQAGQGFNPFGGGFNPFGGGGQRFRQGGQTFHFRFQ